MDARPDARFHRPRTGAAGAACASEPALDRCIVGPIVARERFNSVDLADRRQPVADYRTQTSVPLAEGAEPDVGRGGYLHPRGRRPGASSPTTTCRSARATRPLVGVGRDARRQACRTSGTPAAGRARSSSRHARDMVRPGRRRLPIPASRRRSHGAAAADRQAETWDVRLPRWAPAGGIVSSASPSGTRSCSRARSWSRPQPTAGSGCQAARGAAARDGCRRRRAGPGATPHDRRPAGSRWWAWPAAAMPASPSSITRTTSGIRSRCSWTAASLVKNLAGDAVQPSTLPTPSVTKAMKPCAAARIAAARACRRRSGRSRRRSRSRCRAAGCRRRASTPASSLLPEREQHVAQRPRQHADEQHPLDAEPARRTTASRA